MLKQRFYYTDQRMNINDLAVFISMLLFNVSLFVAELVFYLKGDLDYIAKLVVLILVIIFNAAFISYFVVKIIIMLKFMRKVNRFKTNGKRFRAKIIAEKLGEPIIKSDISKIYNTYHPTVRFYDSSVQEEFTLVSKYPICASYKKALRSDTVTICVIENDFLIVDFDEANDKEYSLERRTSKSRKSADIIDKIDKINQAAYLVGMAIIALIMLGLKVLRYFL